MWLLPFLIVVTTVRPVDPGRPLPGLDHGRPLPRAGWLRWIEQRLDTGPQNWKQYAVALLLFNTVMFVFGFVVLALQPYLPLNPDGKEMLAPTTIFNTARSFLTNTNLQHYSGEQHLSLLQPARSFIVWNMFVSAAVGFCALAAVIRGLRGDTHMGNLLRRYVARGRLRLSAAQPDHGRGAHGGRRADDVREAGAGRDGRSRRDGHGR